MSDINNIVNKLKTLSIDQKDLVSNLIDELNKTNNQSNETKQTTTKSRKTTTARNSQFISSNGINLAVGDTVKILSTRKTGKYGDLAIVRKCNTKYVAVQLKHNHSHTQRAAKNLEFIEASVENTYYGLE